jgi:hypothetical protein
MSSFSNCSIWKMRLGTCTCTHVYTHMYIHTWIDRTPLGSDKWKPMMLPMSGHLSSYQAGAQPIVGQLPADCRHPPTPPKSAGEV